MPELQSHYLTAVSWGSWQCFLHLYVMLQVLPSPLYHPVQQHIPTSYYWYFPLQLQDHSLLEIGFKVVHSVRKFAMWFTVHLISCFQNYWVEGHFCWSFLRWITRKLWKHLLAYIRKSACSPVYLFTLAIKSLAVLYVRFVHYF